MIFPALWQSLEASAVGQYIASSAWAFPTLETLHVISIVTVVGTVAVMDLRLLNAASNECAVTEMSEDTLRWTWAAFVLAMITGGLLFVSKATSYMVNPFFLWKMVLIACAGVNMAIFNFFTWRTVHKWDAGCAVPAPGKLAGALSLGFWIAVVFVARAIGFTLDKFAH